jgi:hypothetical protein
VLTKQRHKLPKNIFEEFSRLSGGTTDTEKQEKLAQRNKLVHLLSGAGWTYSSIGEAVGVSRERVRQIVRLKPAKALARAVEIPSPPLRAVRELKVWAVPSEEDLNRLLKLQPKAQLVRSSSPKFRKEAEEYTALINKVNKKDGVSLYLLARSLGITYAAVYARLVRYGYKPVGKGTSGVYKLIKTANRPLG